MRIAIVTTHPIQYNAPWFRLLAAEPGVEVKVFYTWHTGEQTVIDPGFGMTIAWDIPLLDGYEYELVPPAAKVVSRTFWNMNSPGLNKKIEQWKPDVVLVMGWNFRSHFGCMRYFHGRIPVWFRGDSTLLNEKSGIKRYLRRSLLTRIYQSIDMAMAVGMNNSEYFLRHGVPKQKIAIVPHAIDNDRFGAPEHELEGRVWRRQLGYSEHDRVILFAGKLEPVKAVGDLVNAFQLAVQDHSDLKLLVAGSGPSEQKMSEIAHLNASIQRLPFQNQKRMPALYRVGDATCLCSQSETWGLCLNESLASGRAIIASDKVGACRDLVTPQTGFTFEAGNVLQLATTLRNLGSRDALFQMGLRGQVYIASYSIQAIVQSIVEQLHVSVLTPTNLRNHK